MPLTAVLIGVFAWLAVATLHDLLAPVFGLIAPAFRWMFP